MAYQVLKLTTETTIVLNSVAPQKQLNLFNKYLLLVTFETSDNYSIRFEISNNSSTIRFEMKKHYSQALITNVHIN